MTLLAERKDPTTGPAPDVDPLPRLLPQRGVLYRFIRRLVGGSSDAEDIIQEAYLKLLERAVREPQRETTPGYLFVIARHLVADRGRRLARDDRRAATLRALTKPAEGVGPGLDELVFVEQASECLRRALSELPERPRQAFLLFRLEGLSHRAIARRLGITTRTVERDVALALRHLKRALFRSEEE